MTVRTTTYSAGSPIFDLWYWAAVKPGSSWHFDHVVFESSRVSKSHLGPIGKDTSGVTMGCRFGCPPVRLIAPVRGSTSLTRSRSTSGIHTSPRAASGGRAPRGFLKEGEGHLSGISGGNIGREYRAGALNRLGPWVSFLNP